MEKPTDVAELFGPTIQFRDFRARHSQIIDSETRVMNPILRDTRFSGELRHGIISREVTIITDDLDLETP